MLPVKNLHKKYKYNSKQCCSSVSRVGNVNGIRKMRRPLGMDHLNDRKRTNCC